MVARGGVAKPAGRRRGGGRGKRGGVPAANPDSFPVHPRTGGFRLSAARGLHSRPPHEHGGPVGPLVHPAAVQFCLRGARHHGHAQHSELEGPTDNDHDRTADDLFSAPACLRADHRRVHSRANGFRFPEPAGRGPVRPLLCWHCQRDGSGVGHESSGRPQGTQSADDGIAILSLTILLWFLSSFPAPPGDATGPAIQYSLAGIIGRGLETILAPIGFNWQISIALIPGLAAREVAVGALGTVYALSATGEDVAAQLTPMIAQSWSLATAFSLLAWYVFAPQCISTLSIVRRETNSMRYPLIMAGYLFLLAYAASFITYRKSVV